MLTSRRTRKRQGIYRKEGQLTFTARVRIEGRIREYDTGAQTKAGARQWLAMKQRWVSRWGNTPRPQCRADTIRRHDQYHH